MHRHVRIILPVRVHQQHVPERLVQAHLLVLIRLVPERQRDLVRRLVPVRNQVPVLQALIADRQAEVRQVAVPTVKVERQVAAQGKVQVGETIVVVPIIEITVPREITALPVPVVVAPVAVILVAVAVVLPVVAAVPLLTGVAGTRVLLEAAVALPGAMSLVDKQKDALLPEVREVIALKALPVPLKETAIQEDNLFLYYLYQSHCSSAVGELDSGFSPARLFRAAPVTWISGRILSASISLITPFCASRLAINL